MIYLLLAILSSSAVSIVMRLSSGRVSAGLSMLCANYLACSLLAAAYAGFELVCPEVPGFSTMVWLGLIAGLLFLGGFILLQENIRKNGVVLSSLFMKLGLLVPVTMSVLIFREVPGTSQVLGFLIAVAAIVLINVKRGGGEKGFGIGLLLLLLLGGGADAMSKVYEHFGSEALSRQFLFYNFAFALVLCLILLLVKKERPGLTELFYGTLIGIPNFFSSKFLLASLGQLPAVVVYPSFSVSTLLLVTLAGVALFRERLSLRQWLALALIMAALVLLNI